MQPHDGSPETGGPYPPVPPADATPARLLVVPGAVARRFHADVLADAVAATGPDAVVPAGPEGSVVRPALRSVADLPVLTPGRGMSADVERAGDGVAVVAPGDSREPPAPAAVDGARQHCLVTDALSLSVNPHHRETTLKGLAAYADLPADWLTEPVTHLSTALRPGYRGTWKLPDGGRLTVHGAGVPTGRLGAGEDRSAPALVAVDLFHNGAVTTEQLPPDRFGLRGLTGVGERRAEQLREAGFTDREAVADAPRGALAELPGFGDSTARQVRASARAIARGEVVPTGNAPFPDGEPLFVDIETDGLTASTAWLVGVLDGDRYLAFREQEPGSSDHIEAFLSWLEGEPGRPVVAYNGSGFDFPVLREQVVEHCPDRLEEWDGRYTFDPLQWAKDGNAALPGRTNRLEAVAGALGWTPSTRGLDGATAAETYLTWRRQVQSEGATSPPDWDRLKAYCEDDVRALATVYNALREAAESPTSAPTGAGSAQGSLSDFS